MNWKEAFYAGKREHPQEEKPASLTALLMPSLLGVAICLVCLCSLTWAWFTATQNSGVQPIQSATATVTASLNDTALGELKVGEPCSLNGTGTLTLHMEGDAQYAYVVIKVGDREYHTDYLTADGYTITVNESGAALTLCWGKQDDQSGTAVVENGGSIGTAQPSNTTDEQPAVNGDSQQTPDTTVPANGDANDAGIDDANTGDQSGSNETPGSENGGSTGNGSGEQGSDSGTGSDTGAGDSTGGDAGTGDTSNGTDGTTGE